MGRSRALRIVTVAVAAGLLVAAGACSYESAYVAPQDGRARVVWGSSGPVAELAGLAPSDACMNELLRAGNQSRTKTTSGDLDPAAASSGYYVSDRGYWTPRYYGPPIIVVRPGFVPLFVRPPLFSPSLIIARAAVSAAAVGRLGGGGGGGGGSFRGLGSGKGAGYALIVLAVIALAIMPSIDIGLSAANPESESETSKAIDLVNSYNDLLRTPGTACSLYPAGPPEALPPPMPLPGGAP